MKIYKPVGRAREYSPLALNYFKGCDHGCLYCYCPGISKKFNLNYDYSKVSCDLNLDEIEKSILKLSKEDLQKQVLLSFMGDPYCNFESGQTRQVLEILLKYQIHTAILTKNPEKAKKDIDIFKRFEHFKIGSTLVVADEKQRIIWEPNTINSDKRIEALKYFQSEGIVTWASFEPVIYPKHSLIMLEKILPFIDHVKIGKLNNYKEIDKNVDWAMFLLLTLQLLRKSNVKFYIKKGLAKYNNGLHLSDNELNEDYLNI